MTGGKRYDLLRILELLLSNFDGGVVSKIQESEGAWGIVTSRFVTVLLIASVAGTSSGFTADTAFASPSGTTQPESQIKNPTPPQTLIGPTTESSCGLLTLNGPVTKFVPYPNLHVLNASSVKLKLPKMDANTLAVLCNRDSIIPTVEDGRVLKAQSKPFILSDGVRSGTLSLDKGKYSFAVSGGVLSKSEGGAVDATLKAIGDDAAAHEKKKHTGSKVLGCIGGGFLGSLAAALLAPKRDRRAAAVLGFGAGCAVGWSIAKHWSQKDKDGLDQASQQALDSPSGEMTWQAPESGQQVNFRAGAASEQDQDVNFQHLDSVEAPPQGSRVISRPFRTVGQVVLRSSPDNTGTGNIIGSFNSGQTVEIVGLTPDARWAMVGEDGVIVGYAEQAGFNELSQPLRQVRTERHLVEVPAPARPTHAKLATKRQRAASRIAMMTASPPTPGQIKTTQVRATTQCKSLIASTGKQQDTRTGCKVPNGGWAIA